MNGQVVDMTYRRSVEDRISKMIINNAEVIAKSLANGRDVEIRKTKGGISVAEIRKTVIVR